MSPHVTHCCTLRAGTHCRTQGIIYGTLTTEPNLPAHLRQSLFAEERSWPVAARYSTETSDPGIDVTKPPLPSNPPISLEDLFHLTIPPLQDRVPQPRGLAMKLFDVTTSGDMFPAGADLPTQDIEFNSTPAIELADAKTTREIFALRRAHAGDAQANLDRELEKRPDAELQKARDKVPNTPLHGLTWYGQTAYRFGDWVCKYRLVPESEAQKRASGEELGNRNNSTDEKQKAGHEGMHSASLATFHLNNAASWLFQVQLLEQPASQSVEYGGAPWDESKFPWQTVARLRAPPQQKSWNYGLKNFWEDRMRVDPWMGLRSLEPLGGANRLRREVYPRSSGLRRRLNATTVVDVRTREEIWRYASDGDMDVSSNDRRPAGG